MLAATDFSPGALSALHEARWLAERAGLELQVLHVSTGPTWDAAPASLEWLRAASVDRSLMLVRRGLAWVEVIRHAREVSAAIVVVGSHGASGVQRLRIGSTASRIATGAFCPVLVVAGGKNGGLPAT